MELSTKYVLLGSTAALVLAFSAGRFSAPIQTKTIIQEKVVYKDKVDDTKAKDTVSHTTTTKKPDGTVVTVTDKETKSNEHKTDDISSTTTSSQTSTTENRPNWRLGVAYNPGINGLQDRRYTGLLQRRIISEIYVGINADTGHSYGVNLSVGF